MKKQHSLSSILALALACSITMFTQNLWAIGEASTNFNVYVPPHADNNKYYTMLVITANGRGPGSNGETTVNVWDMPADYCVESDCDPFGMMQSGKNGTISGNSAPYTFKDSGATFSKDSIGHYLVVGTTVYIITAYSSASQVSLVPVSGSAATGSGLKWAQARAANITKANVKNNNTSITITNDLTTNDNKHISFHKDDIGRANIILGSINNTVFQLSAIGNSENNNDNIKDATLSSSTNKSNNSTTMIISRPPDIDDSFKGVKLKRGESFVVYMGGSNPCITGTCTDLNATSPQSALNAASLRTFFNDLNPDDYQKLALEAAITSQALKQVYDDDHDDVIQKTAQRDGDYFIISSDSPVTVHMANKSDYEHDYAVSDGKNSLGHNFYIFTAPGQSRSDRDIEVVAYHDDTYLTIYEIGTYTEDVADNQCSSGHQCVCTGNKCQSAIAEADWDNRKKITKTIDGKTIDHWELDAGQSLNIWNRTIAAQSDPAKFKDTGIALLKSGKSYYLEATRPVTVQYGALQTNMDASHNRRARDGGGMVPSSNGTSSGNLFYFTIPYGNDGSTKERELRISSFDDENTVCLYGFDTANKKWVSRILPNASSSNPCITLTENGRLDVTGENGEALTNHDLFKLTCSAGKKIAVTEANWMETGSIGTSDMASFISAQNSEDEFAKEVRFLAYMPPPGNGTYIANQGVALSNLYIFAEKDNTTVTIRPTDITGAMPSGCSKEFPKDGKQTVSLKANGFYNFRMGSDCYNALNHADQGIRPYLEVIADQNVSVLGTNHNDNWMNFVASLLPATPNVTATVEPPLISISQNANTRVSSDNINRLDTADVTIEARHLFPINRSEHIENATLTITIPDGLEVVDNKVSFDGASSSSPTVSTNSSTGVTTITIANIDHPPFVSLMINFKVKAKNKYKNGNYVSPFVSNKPTEDSLVISIKESGTLNGEVAAGFGSAVARIFRCNVGDTDYDPDGDGQCSGTGACHTVGSSTICAGADMCPFQYGSNFDEPGRCPTGYICDSWGDCYADSDYARCSSSNLQGSCAAEGHGVKDKGLTCINGTCDLLDDNNSCEKNGTYCPSGLTCINKQCVDIDGGDACWQRDDGFGKCTSSYSCIMNVCKSGKSACTTNGGYCAHDLTCNSSGKCVEVPENDRCNDGHAYGDCPHREACLSTLCVDPAANDRCENGGSLCQNGYSCQNKKCAPIPGGNSCENDLQGRLCPHNMACLDNSCYWLDRPAVCDELYGLCDFDLLDKCSGGHGYCSHSDACLLNGCQTIASGQECGISGGLCPHDFSCKLLNSQRSCTEITDDDACRYGGSYCPQSYACLNKSCQAIATNDQCGGSGYLCPHKESCVQESCYDMTVSKLCSAANQEGYCPHGQTCLAGVCYSPAADERCEQNGNYCPHSEACLFKECLEIDDKDRCRNSNNGGYCQQDLSCQDKTCIELASDEECENGGSYCPHNLSCIDNKCVKLNDNEACGKNGSYCPHKQTCLGSICQEPEWDDLCENGGTLCPHNESCINHRCVIVENDNDRCENGGIYCPHGQACMDHKCMSFDPQNGCSAVNPNGYCAHDQICIEGLCQDYVPSESCDCNHPQGSCPQGQSCKCPESAPDNCSAENCGCQADVILCDETHPDGICLDSRMLCLEGSCRIACSPENSDGYCADNQECRNGSCQNDCSNEHQDGFCFDGKSCINGECLYECSLDHIDGYCPNNQVCKNGVCKTNGDNTDADTDDPGQDDDTDADTDQPVGPDEPADDTDNSADSQPDSGCNCHDGGSFGGSWPFFILALMAMKRRKYL